MSLMTHLTSGATLRGLSRNEAVLRCQETNLMMILQDTWSSLATSAPCVDRGLNQVALLLSLTSVDHDYFKWLLTYNPVPL